MQKRLEMHQKRVEFNRTNSKFELHRGHFYRGIKEEKENCSNVDKEEIKKYWKNLWSNTENHKNGQFLILW